MNYKDIFKDKHVDEEKLFMIVEALDECAYDNEVLKEKISYILNDFHECEYTAWKKINAMEAVSYIGHNGEPIHGIDSMADYLAAIGVTPESAQRMVEEASHTAKAKGSEKGITAPPLHANKWDCFASMAMILSDYWYTVCGDTTRAAMIAYEYLSDPDKKH